VIILGHYFIEDNNIKSNKKTYNFMFNNINFIFNTDSGVFCKDYLDFGSKLLLSNLPFERMNGNVLDLGCGYGPIGIIVAKITNTCVHMVDVNNKALKLAKENADTNKVSSNVKIYESNVYKNIIDKYNFIITNPPIRAGKSVVYNILLTAHEYMNDNGELWFVIRKDQGAKTIVRDMEELYNISIIERSKGYFIIKAVKK
jgi:16S rRNA (guanine1207-N2)-methyltransferase